MAVMIRAARGDGEVAPEAVDVLRRVPPETVLALARFHGVGGLLHRALAHLDGIPTDLLAELRAGYDSAVQAHLRKLWELAALRRVLGATETRWALVKGPAAVEQLYADPGLRPYLDLDVLVDPKRFGSVITALEAGGSAVLDRNWPLLRRELLGEVHLRLPGATPLDLHWNLLNMNRGQMWIDTDAVLERSHEVDLGSIVCPVLSAEDAVLHFAVHAAVSGGDRLLWFKDIERAATLLHPDWTVVGDRALEWGVAAPAGLMFARSIETLGAPVPPWLAARLLDRRLRRVVGLVERTSPWELSVGRLTAVSHLVSRMISHGALGATTWFARRTLKRLDPREPAASSVFTARGTEDDRQAFIEAVTRTGARPIAGRSGGR